MRTNLYYLLTLFLATTLLYSCKEKELELEASPDMLFSVRGNEVIVEVKDVPNKVAIKEAVKKKLEEEVQFVRGNVYEMIQSSTRTINLYENLDSFVKERIKMTGQYTFATEEMAVTYEFGDVATTYWIDGYFGNTFYNHFVKKEGTGSHHTMEASLVFCLHKDYLKELEAEYPELNVAYIKTDMITVRRLETFK